MSDVQLIREYVRSILAEGSSEVGTPEWARWFHLSQKNLGPKFVFDPRIPVSPSQSSSGTIEDDSTKRTSWASSIFKAQQAIGMMPQGTTLYIYAVHDLPNEVDLQDEFKNCDDRLSTPDNEYGPGFERWRYEDSIWDEYDQKPPTRRIQQDLEKCVPDAMLSGEHWATSPVEARLIGTLKNHKITWTDG